MTRERSIAKYTNTSARDGVLGRVIQLSVGRPSRPGVPGDQDAISWARIGDLLGTSAQATQERYGTVVEQV